jgi:hypothetical protein
MRSMVEGPFPSLKNPSTALRAVPLPRNSGGGFPFHEQLRRVAGSKSSPSRMGMASGAGGPVLAAARAAA